MVSDTDRDFRLLVVSNRIIDLFFVILDISI